jgi:uncharacterized protein (TIGR03000 family)
MRRRWLIVGILALVGTASLTESAHAQRFRRGPATYYNDYYPGYYDNYPTYSEPSYYPQSGSFDGRSWYFQPGDLDQGNKVFVTVRVPTTNAQLWFGDHRTQQSGRQRTFESPPLESGTYAYHIRAKWQQNGQDMEQTRDIRVRPGQQLTVDFNQAGTQQQGEQLNQPARQSNQGNLNEGQQGANDRRQNTSHVGKLLTVKGTEFTMQDGSKKHTHTLAAKARILSADGSEIKLSDIQPGQRIRVTTREGDESTVTRIEVMRNGQKQQLNQPAPPSNQGNLNEGQQGKNNQSNQGNSNEGQQGKSDRQTTSHVGKLLSVKGTEFTMQDGSKKHTHTLAAKARILSADGSEIKLSDIQPGQRIRVTTREGDESTATRIEVMRNGQKQQLNQPAPPLAIHAGRRPGHARGPGARLVLVKQAGGVSTLNISETRQQGRGGKGQPSSFPAWRRLTARLWLQCPSSNGLVV